MPRVQAHKLFSLFEQDGANGSLRAEGGYEKWVRRAFGLAEGDDGLRRDDSLQEFSAKDVDFADLTRAFLGRGRPHGPTVAEVTRMLRQAPLLRMAFAESEGHVVLPSHFSNVSAYVATVFGLLDAMTLEGYDPVPEKKASC